MTTETATFESEIERLQGEMERWRRSRENMQARIPEEIWESAVELARDRGISPIAKAVGLKYGSLKRRVMEKEGVECQGQFVQLDMMGVGTAPSAQCTMELLDADGARMVIRVTGRTDLDVEALAALFWRRGI